jgi:hypothetical protein
MERGPRAVGPDRKDAGRRLQLGAADPQRGVDPPAPKQLEQDVAERVSADRPGAAHGRAELRQRHGRPARRSRRGDPDLLDEPAALSLRNLLHRPDEDVDHVDAERDRVHLARHSPTAWVVP